MALISCTSKVMLKILQARLQKYMKLKRDFQMFKLVSEKAEEPEIKLSTFAGSLKKQENTRKTPTSALLITPKPLTDWNILAAAAAKSLQSCLTLCYPTERSPTGSSVHRIV